MNQKYIILSLLLVLTIGVVAFNYANQLTALFAEGTVPNPGHPLNQIEGSENLATKAYVDDAIAGVSGSSHWTANGTNIYNSNSGNVGIGTVSPSAKLEVDGNIIASNPTAANHVATKDYVDNLAELTWPDGGQPGDTLIMGVTGPFWNSPLTWDPIIANRKTAFDCDQIGGTVFDTGGGKTICRYPGSDIPAGWTQAANWQRYSPASFGGDSCGWHMSTGPSTFANQTATLHSGGDIISGSVYGACTGDTAYWWSSEEVWESGVMAYALLSHTENTPTSRVEIGIY